MNALRVLVVCPVLLVGCTAAVETSWFQQTSSSSSYDVMVDCEETMDDVAALQAAVDESIGQPSWTVKVVGTCDFAGSPGGLSPKPVPCNIDEDCPVPFMGARSCDPRASAPAGYDGFCFVHIPDLLPFMANADPYGRATNTVFITSSVTIDGYEATIVGGGLHAGWDGDLIYGGFDLTPPDLITGIPAAPLHPARTAPTHWDGVSYGVDFTPLRFGGRWARAYPDIDVTIRGFHLESGFVSVGAARNVAVEDNVSRDVATYFFDAWYKNGPVLRSTGVVVGGFLLAPWMNVQRFHTDDDLVSTLQPTGSVVVRQNTIDGVGEDPVDVSIAYDSEIEPLGIITVFSNADIKITQNTVKNVAVQSDFALSKGIAVIDNLGTTLVDRNSLDMIAHRGIVDWSYFLPSNHATITNNRIRHSSEAGIASMNGSHGDYRHNRIEVANMSASCVLFEGTRTTLAGENVCGGTGAYGLLLRSASNNTFRGNNLAAFDPGIAHVGLESSSHNVFVGFTGNVLEDISSHDNTFTPSK